MPHWRRYQPKSTHTPEDRTRRHNYIKLWTKGGLVEFHHYDIKNLIETEIKEEDE